MRYKSPVEIPHSDFITDFEWIGERIPVSTDKVRGDTYPITWADDDGLYAGTGDPFWMPENGVNVANLDENIDWYAMKDDDRRYRRTGGLVVEKLTGGPEGFGLERINDMPDFIGPGGGGPKPCGMICVDGVLYFAAHNLLGWKPPRFRKNSQHGSDATILASHDHGQTWTPDIGPVLSKMEAEQYIRPGCEGFGWGCPPKSPVWLGWKTPPEAREEFEGWKPMFPGNLFGGPSFVQFGKNNRDAVDDYVYAVSADHWDNGSEMRLGRVHKEQILDAAAWEYADTDGDGGVAWHKGLAYARPILTIEGHMSLPEMVYISSIKRYLLATWALHQDFHASAGSQLILLESENMFGPFHLVHYEWMWYKKEAGCYCPRIPLKWFDFDKLTGWLLHSGNWETHYPYYVPQIRPFKLTIQ